MKNILTILICLTSVFVNGQKKPVKANVVPKLAPVVNLSVGDMSAALNASGETKLEKPEFVNGTTATSLTDFDKIDAQNVNDYLFGNQKTREIGILYWSDPVLKAYNTFIKPNILDFQAIDFQKNMSGDAARAAMVKALSNALVKKAQESGAYMTKGAIDKLREAVQKEFQYESFPFTGTPNAAFPEYYTAHLAHIYQDTKIYLDKCATPAFYMDGDQGYQQAVSGQAPKACHDDQVSSSGFMSLRSTALLCANTVFYAYNSIYDKYKNSGLAQDLALAEKGKLFQPLVGFKGVYPFDIYAIRMSFMQASTKANNLRNFYDPDCQCPSKLAFSPWGATKVRTASVNNP